MSYYFGNYFGSGLVGVPTYFDRYFGGRVPVVPPPVVGGGGGRVLWTDLPMGRSRKKPVTARKITVPRIKRVPKPIQLQPELIEPKPKPKVTRKITRKAPARFLCRARATWTVHSHIEERLRAEEEDFYREQDDMQAVKMLLELI